MKLKFKEDPREWRKTALMTAMALVVISSVLRWRHVLKNTTWVGVIVLLGILMLCAVLKPLWFRGFYRGSMRLGFHTSQAVGFVVLILFFIFILTPLALALRLSGKDLLRLKRRNELASYWTKTGESRPLDSSF